MTAPRRVLIDEETLNEVINELKERADLSYVRGYPGQQKKVLALIKKLDKQRMAGK
jgi:hypothetical protein